MFRRFARTHTKPLEGFFTEVMLLSRPVEEVTQRPLSLVVCLCHTLHCFRSRSSRVLM